MAASGAVEGRSVISDATAVPEELEEDEELEDNRRLTKVATATAEMAVALPAVQREDVSLSPSDRAKYNATVPTASVQPTDQRPVHHLQQSQDHR